jgi:hypothetical protein
MEIAKSDRWCDGGLLSPGSNPKGEIVENHEKFDKYAEPQAGVLTSNIMQTPSIASRTQSMD